MYIIERHLSDIIQYTHRNRSRRMPRTSKRKATFSDTSTVKKLKQAHAAERVFSTPELLGRIVTFVPKNDISLIQRVSKTFQKITKFDPVQEYLHRVPSNRKAGREMLRFRGERISDFIQQVALIPKPSLVPTRRLHTRLPWRGLHQQ